MNLVPQSLSELQSFEKGGSPFKSLDIGLISKINKITSSDLELLDLYTDGYGKDKENPGLIDEIWEDDPEEASKQKKRAREIFKLLGHYEYFFGDRFYAGMKAERNEYIHDYLRNPAYNYAYNYYSGNDEWYVFLSEIKLPSATEIR